MIYDDKSRNLVMKCLHESDRYKQTWKLIIFCIGWCQTWVPDEPVLQSIWRGSKYTTQIVPINTDLQAFFSSSPSIPPPLSHFPNHAERIKSRPMITQLLPGNQTAQVGTNVTYECQVFSDTTPHFVWMKWVNSSAFLPVKEETGHISFLEVRYLMIWKLLLYLLMNNIVIL